MREVAKRKKVIANSDNLLLLSIQVSFRQERARRFW